MVTIVRSSVRWSINIGIAATLQLFMLSWDPLYNVSQQIYKWSRHIHGRRQQTAMRTSKNNWDNSQQNTVLETEADDWRHTFWWHLDLNGSKDWASLLNSKCRNILYPGLLACDTSKWHLESSGVDKNHMETSPDSKSNLQFTACILEQRPAWWHDLYICWSMDDRQWWQEMFR